jgi:hypothetical protein
MKFLVKDILRLINNSDSNKLKLIDKTFAIDDNGRIFFVLTPLNKFVPQKYYLEEILENKSLLDNIEQSSLNLILDVFERVKEATMSAQITEAEETLKF